MLLLLTELSVCTRQTYLESAKEIRSLLGNLGMTLPHFHDLGWRVDVQVASRAVRRQVEPVALLNLQIKTGGAFLLCVCCVWLWSVRWSVRCAGL